MKFLGYNEYRTIFIDPNSIEHVTITTDLSEAIITSHSGALSTSFMGEEKVKHLLNHLKDMGILSQTDLMYIYKRAGQVLPIENI